MNKIIILRVLILSLGLSVLEIVNVFGQYNSNSLYSFYGVGDIDRSGFGQNRALGGLSICLRQPNQINFLNPASYNSQDTMSFMWDIGMFLNFFVLSSNNSSTGKESSNFDHLAISLPISQKYCVSAGLVPFSSMGYDIESTFQTDSISRTVSSYVGSGNLNQFYVGNAFGFFHKHLNLGFNFSYIFGSLNTNNSVQFFTFDSIANGFIIDSYQPATFIERKMMASGTYFNFGAQGVIDINENRKIILGLTFNPKTKIKINYSNYIIRDVTINDTIQNVDTSGYFILPLRIGFGLSIILKNKLLIGADFAIQDWSKSTFLGKNDSLKTDSRISVGVQYTPNSESYRNYFERVDYRIGAYYNKSYLTLNEVPVKDYGLTFGIGLPFKKTRTKFNIAFEIGQHGTTSNNLVRINYTRITVSLSLCDFWFVRKRLD